MKYDDDLEIINNLLPGLDLIKEKDFDLFENRIFAEKVLKYFSEATDNIRAKLNIELLFAFRLRQNFNARAHKENDKYIIIINHGTVDQLSKIIQDSISIFKRENIVAITGLPTDEDILLELFIYLISSYLFYHEFAHILQLSFDKRIDSYTFQEEYDNTSTYNFTNHVYEMDADLFGIAIGTILILQYIDDNKLPKNYVTLYNLLTLYILIVANIFIAFSKNITSIYYKNFLHPHPIIRVINCVEQIINIVSQNTRIDTPFFESILERYSKILDVMHLKAESVLIYSDVVKQNLGDILNYIDEIENSNEQFKELARHRVNEIYDLLGD
ncbi:hypothetical protein HUK80_17680 [Flavobacterium sp. MAH-1]|uniref:Peptidase U49 n=1 Tax=Flavobacterium agri TaxID=2743471 RepID=A0A7Y8Y594_9FLAO|nr:hypothetical protein [Flavobacterium agri]NUY82738.1 hypothetical protein [Flavobacterium agri]NYA72761.1 hypothetical protein [Flavobacterium agri]